MNGATVTVGADERRVRERRGDAASFTLNTNPTLSGLRIASLATVNAGDTSATLTLGYSGGNFNTVYALEVTVAASAHTRPETLTTDAVNIVPTPSVTVSRTSLALTEGGGSGSYTVVLDAQPTGDATVTATSDDAAAHVDTDATPLTKTLTFTTADWNTAQTVTVSPRDDDDAEDESAAITHAASNYGGVAVAGVSVTVDDDETKGIVIDADPSTAAVVDAGPLALAEGATSTTPYAVKLASEPTSAVTVTVTSSNPDAATVDTDAATGLQDTLSFTAGDWNTAQTAWLEPMDDDDPVSEQVDIRHVANGGGYSGVEATLRATVTDDEVGVIVDTDPDTPGDQATPIALREGETRTYRARLSALPQANVTVAVSSGNGAI